VNEKLSSTQSWVVNWDGWGVGCLGAPWLSRAEDGDSNEGPRVPQRSRGGIFLRGLAGRGSGV
jgi:hypothetical protein